ncbi:MAG: hypothetical protein ACRBCI_13735 [Cellvibrionaceae bacterium]
MKIYTAISLLFCLMLFACSKDPQIQVASADEKPSYQDVLELLLENEKVVADFPNANPVAVMYNREAVIPAMCYTKTEGKHNPCYVCHQDAIPQRENTMNDGELQAAYSFSDLGLKNHWNNLFEDRSERVANISDKAILKWIEEDNYSDLAERLDDVDFKGWIPDLKNLQKAAAAFDKDGFAKDGSHWVAFNYKPFPSSFWPTNGSTDDVMIRLPEPFRVNDKGYYQEDIYKANLSILEAKIKGLESINTWSINEKNVGVDLNGDGDLSKINNITVLTDYVGKAKGLYYIDSYLYPKDTEFLHTVRYVGVKGDEIVNSTRMKEVRYMRKWSVFSKPEMAWRYTQEGFEKEAGNLPGYYNLGQKGLDNDFGWSIQGFIEDKQGRLRVSSHEENFFCMGCHGSIGATIDKTFSFARKIDGKNGWGYIDLKGMPDAPNKGEEQGEFATYFERVGGGGEFRSNTEMQAKWFNKDGTVNQEAIAAARDVYDLITPSRERALELNKAYKVIVEDQDFIFGRDATVKPPINVYTEVSNETSPTLPLDKVYQWDIRLDWQSAAAIELAEESSCRLCDWFKTLF